MNNFNFTWEHAWVFPFFYPNKIQHTRLYRNLLFTTNILTFNSGLKFTH